MNKAAKDEQVDARSVLGPPTDSPLTTKEGWRRFVSHDPVPPQLLSDFDLAALGVHDRAAYDQARRDYHSDLPLVSTPPMRKATATARLLLQLNKHQISARRGIIISGLSGTGKTTALTQLGRAHELAIRRMNPNSTKIPVVYITVPPAATPKMLAMEFARFFGLPIPARANLTDVINAVCTTASRVGVDLVGVDELHNIDLTSRLGAEVSDVLKYFAERFRATFVYAGIGIEDNGLLSGVRGQQIAGRFTLVPTTAFEFGNDDERAAWAALVGTLESMLRLHRHQQGALEDLAEYFFTRSQGMIGSLSQLIRGAAILAIDDGSEQITKDLLDLVPVDHAATQSHRASRASRHQPRKRRAA